VVTLDAYKKVHGEEPTSTTSTFGWTEKDGLVENFPTDDSEKVFYGDSVLVHDEVHINPCYTWYVDFSSYLCYFLLFRFLFLFILIIFTPRAQRS